MGASIEALFFDFICVHCLQLGHLALQVGELLLQGLHGGAWVWR
jgi:hypothetical protein